MISCGKGQPKFNWNGVLSGARVSPVSTLSQKKLFENVKKKSDEKCDEKV